MSDEKKYPKLEYISSCTINDAVAKMLGWLQGPVYDENIKFAEDGNVHEEDLLFLRTLPNTIEEQITYLIGVANMELSEAKSKKASPDVIEEKTKILNKRYKEMELAYRYKLDIEHELNKGISSVLVIDRKITKESGEKHITIRGLHDWTLEKYGISIEPLLCQQLTSGDQQNQSTANIEADKNLPKVAKRKLQERRILDEIKKCGYPAKELPKNQAGKRGIKAKIKAALENDNLFVGTTVFDKAWQGLRDCKEIKNKK
jgi:hypothetical protein